MPNPFGRPAGSKNSKGHDAGGSRANSGRKKKMSEEEKDEAALKTSWEEGHAEIRRAERDNPRRHNRSLIISFNALPATYLALNSAASM